MSVTSSKPLKRLSLLQPSTSLPSPSSSSFSSPGVASQRVDFPDDAPGSAPQSSNSPISSVSSPTTMTRAGQGSKNARRQSSIFYVSQDRDFEGVAKEAHSPVIERRFSAPQSQNNDKRDASEPLGEKVKEKRRSVGVADEQLAPMTLAEKHADLLRFIAQKESKCLELRSQLAAEEAELLALKRKWERIVGRGFRAGSSASVSSLDTDPSAQDVVLAGLKEGVQGVGRLLAQLGDLGSQGNDTGHASNSSISTTLTSSSSIRLSQSSISSLGIIEDEALDVHKNATPDSSSESHLKRHSLSTPVRRRPYEPASPSTPSPPILTPRTPLSAAGFFSLAHTESPAPKLSRSQSTIQTEPKHRKRMSIAVGSFPPASSIPGVSVAPLASWVDNVGKRLGQLHISGQAGLGSQSRSNPNSSADTQSIHKRASTLLSDASNSLFAALTSPTRHSPVIDLTHSTSPSLLDDDNDMLGGRSDTQWASMSALSPERPKVAPVLAMPSVTVKKGTDKKVLASNAKGSDADSSDEWNW